ncbi:MAG: TIGR04283 family arsenosugar biosynthesis glycosyltransferase [Thermoanaerobaculia bacterium]|nr:TIGR04283 family arsenosugar biosynthesis glycosyltransferase [Thermoanaerobaculia bacterium]
MPHEVSVVIAARNEESLVGDAVRSAFDAGAIEVLVVDGSSTDATAEVALRAGARVIASEPMRAQQLNAGAKIARGTALIFLHADTTLPSGAAAAVATALDSGAHFGGFRIAFVERAWRLRFAAAMINLRTRITRCPWGDQAQFIARSRFMEEGGYRWMPLLEDYEMAVRMKRHAVVLPLTVTTSGRRFVAKGVLRTAWINWRIITMYRMGVDPGRLAERYRCAGGGPGGGYPERSEGSTDSTGDD